jgi:putative RNA 2'-phosphotransferase
MVGRDLTRLSKFLSLILRHEPGKFGVVLDGAGWTEVEMLLAACGRNGHAIDRAMLEEIVATSEQEAVRFRRDVTCPRASSAFRLDKRIPPPQRGGRTFEPEGREGSGGGLSL